MKRNSWVTTLERPSQNQGPESTPLLISASFSVALHLNWQESISSSFFPSTYSCHCTYCLCICSFSRKSTGVIQGKNFKDVLEHSALFQPASHNSCVYTDSSQLCHFAAIKIKKKHNTKIQVKVLRSLGFCSLFSSSLFNTLLSTQRDLRANNEVFQVPFLLVPKTPCLNQISHYLLLYRIKKLFSFSTSFQPVTSTLPQGS